jgi:adenosyl cobinamide kinase/adenosyl cobinamide phosphate guanylyltransferase
VIFIATAEALDDDMAERIARHRAERPPTWTTIEEPHELASALAAAPRDACVIVDCLTLWLTNRLLASTTVDPSETTPVVMLGAVTAGDAGIMHETEAAIAFALARTGPTIVVTNEVGLGVVPPHPLGRTFRDALGRVNAAWAAAAGRSLFLVAGRALPLVDPILLLGGHDG